jgi:tRNA acetyltransferase TAN1
VVPSDYDSLKKYNLAEIFDPTPKEQFAKKIETSSEKPAEESKPETEPKPQAVDAVDEPEAAKEELFQPIQANTQTPAVDEEAAQV